MTDIARRAGVSTATVSMGLRNRPNISEDTRRRIREIASELGYQPNPFVSALVRTRRPGRGARDRAVLALVHGLDSPTAWRDSPSQMRRIIREGAIARAAELGFQAQEFWLRRDAMTPERFSAMLYARGIRGLLLGPLADGVSPPPLQWEKFSAVTLSVPFPTLPVRSVCNDHYYSGYHAVHQCQRLGYNRPGLVLRRSHSEHFQGRWEGGVCTAQCLLTDVGAVRPLFVDDPRSRAGLAIDVFRRWLERERPDVILGLEMDLIEKHLEELGHRVPEDLGLCTLSAPDIGHRLSGICQNGRKIGATAIDVLVSLVDRGETGLPAHAITTMVEGVWNPGRTLRDKFAAGAEREAQPRPRTTRMA